jgi:hypothetical protein
LFSLESLVGFIGNYNALPHTQLTPTLLDTKRRINETLIGSGGKCFEFVALFYKL